MIKSTIKLTEKIHYLCQKGLWDEASQLLPEQEKKVALIISWLSKKKKSEINPALIGALLKLNALNHEMIAMAESRKCDTIDEMKVIQKAGKAISCYSL